MIIQHVRHGRTRRDAANLARHLTRLDDNEVVTVTETSGLASSDIASALEAMRRLAAKPNAAAFHHISLSPSIDQPDDELRADARRVIEEMQASDHAFMIVQHRKPSVAGRAENHIHLVVSHWGLGGKALDDGWLHLRLERVAREIEFDRKHVLTPGRHDKAVMRALRNRGRTDVAEALAAIQPDAPPRSAITSEKRQALKREGVSDVDLRVAVKAAWDASDDCKSLRAALAADGLDLREGRKPGVWIVAHGDIEVGALDRILRLKRNEVTARLSNQRQEQPRQTTLSIETATTIESELAVMEREARQRYGRASGEITRPAALVAEQGRVTGLRQRAVDAIRRHKAASDALCTMRQRQPRGFWAWLTGRSRRHRLACQREEQRLRKGASGISRLNDAAFRSEERLRQRLDAWERKADEVRRERQRDRHTAASLLQAIADARLCLEKGLAGKGIKDAASLIASIRDGAFNGARRPFLAGKSKRDQASRQPVPGATAALTLHPAWATLRTSGQRRPPGAI